MNKYDASDIQVLEGLEPVRLRPGMYIGGTDEKAWHHLPVEIMDNSIDEAVAGFAKKIVVNLAPADIKKEGSSFDLPIAIGILCSMEIIKNNVL